MDSDSPYNPLRRVIENFDGTALCEEMNQDFMENRSRIKAEHSLKVKGSSIEGVLSSAAAEKALGSFAWEYEREAEKRLFGEKHRNSYRFLVTDLACIDRIVDTLDNNPELTRKYLPRKRLSLPSITAGRLCEVQSIFPTAAPVIFCASRNPSPHCQVANSGLLHSQQAQEK